MKWMDKDGWHEEEFIHRDGKRKYERRAIGTARMKRKTSSFDENRERLRREESQLAHPEVEKFILEWQAQFGDKQVLESDLWPLAESIPDMPDFEGWSREWGWNLTRLLLRLRGRMYAGMRLCVGLNPKGKRVFWIGSMYFTQVTTGGTS